MTHICLQPYMLWTVVKFSSFFQGYEKNWEKVLLADFSVCLAADV
jgi:hypothetical protein